MKKSRTLVVLLLSLFAVSCAQGAAPTEVPIDEGGQVLSDEEKGRLEELEREPNTVSIFITLFTQITADDTSITIPISPSEEMVAERVSASVSSEGRILWRGETPESGRVALTVSDGAVTGFVETAAAIYKIVPLSLDPSANHAVVKQDALRLPPDHPPESAPPIGVLVDDELLPITEGLTASDTGDAIQFDTLTGQQLVDLLVAYTPGVSAVTADPDGLIQLAIDEANVSYQNTNVNLSVRSVETLEVDYTETTYGQMMSDLSGRFDGSIDNLHQTRAETAADVIVLIVNNPTYCGLADAILADRLSAFAIVHYNCATGSYSFAHEIGHLLGARHDPAADPSTTPFSYGHGFREPSSSWRTIMAYDCALGCPRIQYWSSSTVTYSGDALGNADESNNSGVLGEMADRIAGFMPSAWLDSASVLGDGSAVLNNPTLVGDVDGDGMSDLIFVGDGWSGPGLNVRVKFSNGDGSWRAESQILGDGSAVFNNPTLVGDVDGDGMSDLIFVGQGWSGPGLNIRAKLSNGDGTWTAESQVRGDGEGVHTNPALVGDVNGDGLSDLIFIGQNWSGPGLNVRVKLSNGDGNWSAVSQVLGDGPGVHTHRPLIGDIDGDSHADLILVGDEWNGVGLNVHSKISNLY